jgi:hypothetical protein
MAVSRQLPGGPANRRRVRNMKPASDGRTTRNMPPAGGIKQPGGGGFSTFLSKMGQNAQFKGSGDSRQSYEPNKQVRDFQPYGVGKPKYGGGRSMPNVGPVTGREGYRERDLKARVMKARQQKLLKQRKFNSTPKPDRTM